MGLSTHAFIRHSSCYIYDLREEHVISPLNGYVWGCLGLPCRKSNEFRSILLKYNELYLITLERDFFEIIRDKKEAPTLHPKLFPLFDDSFGESVDAVRSHCTILQCYQAHCSPLSDPFPKRKSSELVL